MILISINITLHLGKEVLYNKSRHFLNIDTAKRKKLQTPSEVSNKQNERDFFCEGLSMTKSLRDKISWSTYHMEGNYRKQSRVLADK